MGSLRDNALIDSSTIRRFAGIDLAKDNIPDATTILAFRHFVEQHQLAEEIFKTVGQYLREKSLMLWEGTVVDATIPGRWAAPPVPAMITFKPRSAAVLP